MDGLQFRQRIRERLRETGGTPIQLAEQAGLPRDSIRSVLRGHEPSVLRADEICRALGITVTIGVRRVLPQPVDEAGHLRTSSLRAASQERSTVECFADLVDGPLADLFGRIVEVYGKGRTDGERRAVASMLSHMTTAVSHWITATVEEGGPPMKPFIPTEELVGDE